MGSVLIVAAILVLMGPKRMMHIVIAALIGYSFPIHTLVAAIIFCVGYYLHKKYNPFR